MGELIEKHGNLSAQDAEWLHLLVGDWQVISDLAFADLVLWMPDREGDFVALAHARPSTGATVHHDEVVGEIGRASCRERVWISVVNVALKKKMNKKMHHERATEKVSIIMMQLE